MAARRGAGGARDDEPDDRGAALLGAAAVGGVVALDENERAIIRLRFGLDDDEPRTLEEIGSSFGVTRERVRQIESRALGKLREAVTRSDIMSLEAI